MPTRLGSLVSPRRRSVLASGPLAAFALAAAVLAWPAAAQPCVGQWDCPFSHSDPSAGLSFLRFFTDQPSGHPMMLVAGGFTSIGDVPSKGVATWDGQRWAEMGAGLTGTITASLEFDDGTGPALYVAGDFLITGTTIRGIARWRNHAWESVGTPQIGGFPVQKFIGLVVHDEGNGPRLFGAAATGFNQPRIIRLDGPSWVEISGPFPPNTVKTLAAVEDGALHGLYVGGSFYNLDGAPIARVAKWDGAGWGPLGGDQPYLTTVLDIEGFDAAPGGQALYMLVQIIGSQSITRLIRYDGATWTDAPPEVPRLPMRVIHREGAERMYFFDEDGVRSWDGAAIDRYGPAQSEVSTFDFDDASGAGTLCTGGFFAPSGYSPFDWEAPKYVARLENDAWVRFDNGLPYALDCLATIELGEGETLFAAMREGDDDVIVRLRDGKWGTYCDLPFGATLTRRLIRFDRGGAPGQPTLYAAMGGTYPFFGASGKWLGLAKWDGVSWSRVGGGLTGLSYQGATTPGWVFSAVVFNDGQGGGEQLYVSGSFSSAGAVPALNIARWDGAAWSAVGDGLRGRVFSMLVFDDGSGPRLYATGSLAYPWNFSSIARWDGVAWEPLPPPGFPGYETYALAAQTVNGQPRLVAAGGYGEARWDGVSWEPMRPLQSPYIAAPIDILANIATSEGPLLVAAGDNGVRLPQHSDGTPPVRPFALWLGERWQIPTTGLWLMPDYYPNATVISPVSFDDGSGPALWIGGSFSRLDYTGDGTGAPATNIARFRLLDFTCPGDITFDGVIDMLDLNAVLSAYGTAGSSAALGPTLPADCNLDGAVDFRDLDVVLSAFGTSCE